MEVSSLRQAAVPARPSSVRLLRLASDDRLIALMRRGNHGAFEALVQRYNARLLSFCRHMLGSREDAEDVLQDVFVAAFNAILADERKINVRPWLYRIARNRSLNHLRRPTATGVDSMDEYFADHGLSVPERFLQRERFRGLVGDIGQLAESQRTALLLREIDDMSYEQISEAMDTTVPSVKSLLVRARVSLAEAAEARALSCQEVRHELAEVAEGLTKISPPVRRHVRDCDRCRSFRTQLKRDERALAAVLPVGIPALLHKLLATKLGSTTGAGGAYAAGGTGAGTGAGLAAGSGVGAATGFGGLGGLAGIGTGAIATKAVAGLAAAALLTAGAVASEHAAHPTPHRIAAPSGPATAEAAPASIAPVAVGSAEAHVLAVRSAHAGKAVNAMLGASAHRKGGLHAGKASKAAGAKTGVAPHGVNAAGTGVLPKPPSIPTVHRASSAPSAEAVEVTTSTTQLTTTPANSPDVPAPPVAGAGTTGTTEVTTTTSASTSSASGTTSGSGAGEAPAPPSGSGGGGGGGEGVGENGAAGGTEAPPA
ncbi:MAG: RNA polymerase sigma factor [Solirubrobacteraceae bacterium]